MATHPLANLMIVTKNQNIDDVKLLIASGYKIFGENRVQEAQFKYKDLYNINDLHLHLIGPLQSNKVKVALNIFHTIQTIDRLKIADEIKKNINSKSLTSNFFIQINIGDEPQKSGVKINQFEELYAHCLDLGLSIKGLMCIPPANNVAEKYFQELLSIRDNTNKHLKLSMGMSNDYLQALKYHSDVVRIGSLIFSG
jgi:PLP dependent protein